MTAIVDWVVAMTIWTALICAAARVADRLLERRVSARARMAIYLAVAARLAFPVRWDGGVAVAAASRAVTSATASVVSSVAAPSGADADSQAPALPWVLAAVWLTGVVALVAARLFATRRATSGLRPARASLVALSPRASVLESDGFGPAVVGVSPPRIVVPSALADSLDPRALAWIVRHETSHIESCDPLLCAALQFAVAALWPVAPLWFALRRVRSLMEVACDERTLALSDSAARGDYMRTLIEVGHAGSRAVRPVAGLAFGRGIVERVRTLASGATRWPRRAQAPCIAALVAGLVACSSNSQDTEAWKTDYVRVKVSDVSGAEVTQTGDDGVERPGGVHMVETQFFAAKPGEPLVVRSKGGIAVSGPAGGPGMSDPFCVKVDGDAEMQGVEFVGAPTVIAFDGEDSSITLTWPESGPNAHTCTAAYKVVSAGDGLVDLSVTFEQREGGVLVREIPASTFRIATGQKAYISTRRPDGVAR